MKTRAFPRISIFAALAAIPLVLFAAPRAKPGETVGDVKWTFKVGPNGLATVTGLESAVPGLKHVEGDVIVPRVLGGAPVGAIGSHAFKNEKFIRSVVLPEGVGEIHAEAFRGCTRLARIELPVSLRKIGFQAFGGCVVLASARLNEGLQVIGDSAFAGCSALRTLAFPSTLVRLGQAAFARTPLESVLIPDGVSEVGGGVFSECRQLKSVVVGKRVPAITSHMFRGCKSLERVQLTEGALDGIHAEAFRGCTSLVRIELPSGIRTIGYCAFSECKNLAEVRFSGCPQTIDRLAFDKKSRGLSFSAPPQAADELGRMLPGWRVLAR